MFGESAYGLSQPPKNENEIERLSRELAEAMALIERLKDALGSNHPLGHHRGIFG